MNCFFCCFPLMAVGVLDSALDRLRSSRSPLRQIAGSFWKAWSLLFLWWRDPLVLQCELNAKLYNVYYAWGCFCLILERQQMKTGPILAMANRVHLVLVLLNWTCTCVIMGWLNCAPGHTSEPRAKSIGHGHYPNPLEVASEECAK